MKQTISRPVTTTGAGRQEAPTRPAAREPLPARALTWIFDRLLPPPITGPVYLPEDGSDPEALDWEPAEDAEDGESWLGVDEAGAGLYLPNYTTSRGGQVRVRHGMVVGWAGSGKSTTLVNILEPGLQAGTEVVLLVDASSDGPDEGLRKLEPYLTRVARFKPERWEQAIHLAWRIMCARVDRGWAGPSPLDPVLTLVIDESAVVADGVGASAHSQMVQLSRLGERVGVRTIQSTHTALSTDLVGGAAWRANARWVVGHNTGSSAHASLATQSTEERVSLLGLLPGQAAVIVDGQVLARRAYIAFPSAAAITEAMHGVPPAQLHPDDLAAVAPVWDLTESWSAPAEPPAARAMEVHLLEPDDETGDDPDTDTQSEGEHR